VREHSAGRHRNNLSQSQSRGNKENHETEKDRMRTEMEKRDGERERDETVDSPIPLSSSPTAEDNSLRACFLQTESVGYLQHPPGR
jgi:hypothetical protein